MGWMQWSVLAAGSVLVLTACATTTTNGMAPQPQGAVSNYPALAAAPMSSVSTAPSPLVRRAPAVLPQVAPSVVPPPITYYSSTALPLAPPAATPSIPSTSTVPAVPPSVAPTLNGAKTSFSGEWQADMTKARQDSARCAAMSSAAQTACWQGVSTWAQKRAARYQSLSTQATGAQAQQMQSAAKFFGVTSEWASACGALTPQQCAESPLIGKMQQWKASVGIPGTTTPTS
ncbi:hypothetical protein [Acidithiobacillus sp.]|uniref:hypothetical protein n=1 Tax=Acidithiobacillus sp. TaxID=1872118 RepID=UPI0026254067|nr:hypothetical protein [Acidithiobacillus sp.]